jgi:hypothetical protein
MAINFNTDPYYDDFSEDKNFHHILFKPGVAVQARELNQVQSILQNQVSKFGSHIFKDGTRVLGGEIFLDTGVKAVRLKPTYNSTDIDVTNFSNLFIKGSTTGVIGEVRYVYAADDPVVGDPATVIIKPSNTSNASIFAAEETLDFYPTLLDALNEGNLSSYHAITVADVVVAKTGSCSEYSQVLTLASTTNINVGDLVTASGLSKTLYVIEITSSTAVKVNEYAGVTLASTTFTFTQKATQPTMEVAVTDGVFFKNGYFLKSQAQSVIPAKYSSYPSASVGYSITESSITSDDDETLLDPAISTYNYFAPGADRFKVALDLVSLDLIDENPDLTNNPDFIEIIRVKEGQTLKSKKTEYSELDKALARRTFDESGNYIVKNFILHLNDTTDSANTINTDVLPGKAYVSGYEIETVAPTRLLLDKARDTENVAGFDISPFYGNYTVVGVPGYSLPALGSNVELHTANTTISFRTRAGTAHVKQIEYDSGSNTTAVYKLFLSSINLTANTFANVRYIVGITNNTYNTANTTFRANVDTSAIVSGNAQLYDSSYDTMIFAIPQNNIENVTATTYQFRRRFADVAFTSGTATITTNISAEDFVGGSGVLPAATARTYYYVVAKTASGTFTAGQVIPMDGGARTVTIPVVGSGAVGQAVFNVSDATFNGTCDIYATIEVQSDTRKNKTLVANTIVSANISAANTYVSLAVSDVYQLNKVYKVLGSNVYSGAWSSVTTYPKSGNVVTYSGLAYTANAISTNINPVGNTAYWTEVTTQTLTDFTLDTGQRDNHYDHGRIKYNGATAPGNVVIMANYFTHSGGIGYFTNDSYPIDYSLIPSYTTTKTGTTYELRDSYDFRPRRTDGSSSLTFDSYQIPIPYDAIQSDFSYYMGRIDKIALTPSGNFKIIKGVSSFTNPGVPSDDADAMTLATLRIPAYTFNSSDVKLDYVSRRRYTMKDIGQIDQRLKSVEYYTALSLLEKEVLAASVLDTNNTALFKNGYLVDSFAGHSVVDVLNREYDNGANIKVSVDSLGGFARPSFESTSYNFTFSSGGNPDVTKTGDLLSLPFTESTFVQQNTASKIINVNPFSVVNFIGVMRITPSSDTWYDTTSKPIINVVENGNKDAWLAAESASGTQWNDWQLNWSSQQVTDRDVISRITNGNEITTITRETLSTSATSSRTGVNTTVGTKLVLSSDSTAVVSQEIIPFARQKTITYKVYGMPPLTRLYMYVNNTIDITSYVTPDGGTAGDNVITDNSGYATGTFTIPNNSSIKIPTGRIRFAFINDPSSFTNATAYAEAGFISAGTLNTEQRTIISTKEPILIRNDVTQTKTDTSTTSRDVTSTQTTQPRVTWIDPVAQTFMVDATVYPNGIYLSSADLYFATKDSTLPVSIQIRPTVSGFPSSSVILPMSEVYKNPSEINIPDAANIYDGISTATNFEFESPVYLAPGEYCLVVISNSNKYTLYAAEIGQTVLGTTNKISTQPYLGVLFKSQNGSTWTPSQTEDLCFKLNQCVFNRGTVSFTVDLEVPTASTDFDLLKLTTQELNFGNDTSITYEIKTKPKTTGVFTDFVSLPIGSNYEFSQTMTAVSAGDIVLRVTMRNVDQNVSPVVDLERVSAILVKNKIDVYSSGINTTELTAFGGTAQAKYITRRVTLADGFDATGLNVNVLVNRRSGTSIKVYYKILNKYDTTDFDDRTYVEIPQTTLAGSTVLTNNPDVYSEENYQALNINYASGTTTYSDFNVFAIKIVFFSSNQSVVPQIKALRVTAVT